MSDQPKTTTYYTAVFRVKGDRGKHNEWWRMMQALKNPETGITVVATASFDALARLDEVEENHMVSMRPAGTSALQDREHVSTQKTRLATLARRP